MLTVREVQASTVHSSALCRRSPRPRRHGDPTEYTVAGRGEGVQRPRSVHVDFVYRWADGVHLNVRLDSEKLCLLVIRPPRRETGPGRDLEHRGPRPRPPRRRCVQTRLRRQVRQSRREDRRRHRRTARLLRLPGRALGAPAYHEVELLRDRRGCHAMARLAAMVTVRRLATQRSLAPVVAVGLGTSVKYRVVN